MKNLLTYSGINTKIKAMKSNFISIDDFKKMAELETTTEFFEFLKNHPGYGDLLKEVEVHNLHRGQAEAYFKKGFLREFASIYSFATSKQRKILDIIYRRYEVDLIKTCMRIIYSGKDENFDLSFIRPFIEKHSKINFESLSNSKNMDEFIANLKDSKYYKLFQRLRKSGHVSIVDYETQLDVYYFTTSWRAVYEELKGDNRRAFTHTLGTEIDLLNIELLIRLKAFYSFDSKDVYASIIPIHYNLSKGKLISLIETNSIYEFAAVLKSTHYKKLAKSLEQGEIEKSIYAMLSRTYQESKDKYPNSMAPIAYHLHLKHIEIDKVTTVLECIRYKLEPNEILSYVL